MKRCKFWILLSVHIGLVLLLAFFNIEGIQTIGRIWSIKKEAFQKEKREKEAEQDTSSVAAAMEILSENFEMKKREEEKKTAYLTFDDGPSDNTDKILDILKKKGVTATFFVVGKTGKKAEERYRRIVEEGHTLGLHSYTHKYEEIYASLENFKEDVLKLQTYLYEVTGEKPWVYRFPGGSSNQVAKVEIKKCIEFLKEEGIVHFDWNASSEDAVSVGVSCTILNTNVLKDALRLKQPVILMHDLHECNNTADGLEALIDRLMEEGYEIRAIGKDTRPVQHVK